MAQISTVWPCRTLIMAALPWEVRPFLRLVKARPRRDLGLSAWEWQGGEALAALSGMGGAAARRAAEILIGSYHPKMLISLGFGGALVPGLAVGDVVLGETFWHYDPDTSELKAGPSPPAPQPLMVLRQALERAGLNTVSGSIITTTRIIHKKNQGEPLTALPYPVLDLETIVLAEIAAALDLPFLSLRAITDVAAEEIPEFLYTAGEPGIRIGAWEVLVWLAKDVRRVKELLRLWHHSRCAARALAKALGILAPLLVAAGCKLEDQPGQEGHVDKDANPA